MPIALLPDRAVVAVSGPDALPFLQGILTCNVETLPEAIRTIGSVHGAHLQSGAHAPFPFEPRARGMRAGRNIWTGHAGFPSSSSASWGSISSAFTSEWPF